MPIYKCLTCNELTYSAASSPDDLVDDRCKCGGYIFPCNTQEARERWERQVAEAAQARLMRGRS